MCKGGGGSPPVPSGSSTSFQSTVTPNSFATPLYQDFLNRANSLSTTPFNPGMYGQVAPINSAQATAGNQLFSLGMDMGNFDPAKVAAIQSPYTQQVVNATQSWFNNQNAIQGNDLMSQAIRSGNAFGGDRAGVAEGVLAGQQQLAQAPVIAGLYQAGYGQALDEYNRLKQFGLQGTGAAMGWGSMLQAQQQREFDVAQQNAMMASAYPFQTLNWYGAILGGIAPLLGSQAVGFNTPPNPGGAGFKRGGMVLERRKQGGLVPVFVRHNGGIIAGLAYGGSADEDDSEKEKPKQSESESPDTSGTPELPEREKPASWKDQIGQLQSSGRGAPQAPSFGAGNPQQPQSTLSRIGDAAGTIGKIIDVGSKVAPFLAVMSDPKTKTDVQRVGKTDGGDPLYAFRYKGDPKSYPKVVGPMARPMGGVIPGVKRYADAGDVDEPLTMRDLGVLGDSGEELPRSITGPSRGSPGSNEGLTVERETGRYSPVQQASDMPNLARVRERFKPELESKPSLAKKFDVTTTAEVGTRPEARAAYQALTMDRAAARGEALGQTITDPRYYPPATLNARDASGQGVSPSLWQGANPANYATGNASFDPKTGRWVGFARGPQVGSVQTGSGTENLGIEGPDLAAARRYGYMGPSRTAVGPRGPQGTGDQTTPGEQGPPSREAGPATAGTGPVGGRIPKAPTSGGVLGGITDTAKDVLRNPLLQFAGAYLSGTSPWGRVNLGNALLKTAGIQEQQRAADIAERRQNMLDNKPELIHTEKGMAYKYPDGTITHLGMKGSAQAEADRKFAADIAKPYDVKETKGEGLFTATTDTPHIRVPDPNNPGGFISVPYQGQGAAPAPAPAPQAPPTGVGGAPVRQTEAPPAGGGGGGAGAAAPAPGGGAGAAAPTPQIVQVQRPPDIPATTGPAGKPPPDSYEGGWGGVMPIGTITNPGASGANRNEGALANATPAQANLIKQLVDYKIDPKSIPMKDKNGVTRAQWLEAASAYDPSYNMAQYPTRAAALKEFGVNGQAQKSLQSNSMVLEHLGDAMTAVDALNNSTWPDYNRITGEIEYRTGGTQYQAAKAKFLTAAKAASTEAAKTFRGVGAMGQQEAAEWNKILADVYDSPVSLRQAMQTVTGLVAGRLHATANGYNTAMGPDYYRSGESFMTPKARETIARAAGAGDTAKNQPFPPTKYEWTTNSQVPAKPLQGQGPGGGQQQQPQQQAPSKPDVRQNGVLFRWDDGEGKYKAVQ